MSEELKNIWGEEGCKLPGWLFEGEEARRCTACCFLLWKAQLDELIKTRERSLCKYAFPSQGCSLYPGFKPEAAELRNLSQDFDPFWDIGKQQKGEARKAVCAGFHCSDPSSLQRLNPDLPLPGIKLMLINAAVENGDLTMEQASGAVAKLTE